MELNLIMKKLSLIIVIVAVSVLAVTIVPLILLVGLNFLGYNVPYTFDTWLGAFFIQIFIGLSTNLKVDKK
jgi:hypothetical protein